MTFIGRLIFVVSGAILAAVLAVAVGCHMASEEVSDELERARVSHLMGSLRAFTEANLALGLSADEIGNLEARIEREKANDPAVLAIDVYSAAGKTLFSTDRSAVGGAVDPRWVKPLAAGDGIFETETSGETVFGTRYENDLGTAGGIAITVSGQERARRSERLWLDLMARTLPLAAGAAFLAMLCAFVFAHALTRPFDRVARILRGEVVLSNSDGGLEQLALQARRSWAKAEEHVDQGLAHLGALDDAA